MADLVTTCRILLVPVFVISMVYYVPGGSPAHFFPAAVFLIACASDALDGYLARLRNESTALGQMLDPIADKLLLSSGFLCLLLCPHGALKPPAWVVILVLSRDFLLVGGVAVLYLTGREVEIKPSRLGKWAAFSQMITIGLLMLQVDAAVIAWRVTVVLTLASGFFYLWREIGRPKSYAFR